MGTKNNPEPNDCYARALGDEPMFVLLGRDPSTPKIVGAWALERMRMIAAGTRPDSDQKVVEEALTFAGKAAVWRALNDAKPEVKAGEHVITQAVEARWRTEAPPLPPDAPFYRAARELGVLRAVRGRIATAFAETLPGEGEVENPVLARRRTGLLAAFDLLDQLADGLVLRFPELGPKPGEDEMARPVPSLHSLESGT